jgi:uncharacterized protein with HEPN domain
MRRDFKVYLDDMLRACEKVRLYTEGRSLDDFASDEKTMDAVVRNLEILGEASKQIPESIREANPGVEWSKISGLRDILIHHYFGIDAVIVWDVVQNKVPALISQITKILSD